MFARTVTHRRQEGQISLVVCLHFFFFVLLSRVHLCKVGLNVKKSGMYIYSDFLLKVFGSL